MHPLLTLAIACHPGTPEAPQPRGAATIAVTVRQVAPTPVALEHEAWGTLVAERVVELRAEAQGQVVAVAFDDGARVRQGDVLVRLRDGLARAALTEAQAQLTLAEADLARAVELRAKDRVSAAEIDALTARRDLAKVAIDRAREAERRTAIRAPFDGWIGVREVDEGDVIDPSTVVGTLYEVDPLRAEVTVPERLASWAQAGAAAVVRVDAWPELTFPATLRYVAPAVDPATRTLTLRLALPNPDGRLRPGMSARAALQLGAPAPTLLLPAESVTTTADGPQVWVVQDGQAHARRVVTGERRDAEIVVLSGLEAGEAVVIEGIVRLREGAAVQVTGDAG